MATATPQLLAAISTPTRAASVSGNSSSIGSLCAARIRTIAPAATEINAPNARCVQLSANSSSTESIGTLTFKLTKANTPKVTIAVWKRARTGRSAEELEGLPTFASERLFCKQRFPIIQKRLCRLISLGDNLGVVSILYPFGVFVVDYWLEKARGEFRAWLQLARRSRWQDAVWCGAVRVESEEAVDLFLKRRPQHIQLRMQLIVGAHGPYSLGRPLLERERDADAA